MIICYLLTENRCDIYLFIHFVKKNKYEKI
jgi:hypothetical protein